MSKLRRSGRISRQIPIALLGTDTSGHVFSEQTTTLVLSRHGAGILSRHKLAPDDTLSLRMQATDREVDVRLVGRMGQDKGSYVYGVAFVDPKIDFWQMEFPPEIAAQTVPLPLTLACELCKTREAVEHSEIEADVYAVNDSVLRFCKSCSGSTAWRRASADSHAASGSTETGDATRHADELPAGSGILAVASGTESSATRAAGSAPVTAVLEQASSGTPLKASSGKPGRIANRRRDVRTTVYFMACVRYSLCEDIVECDNISKGGISFRSRKRYPEHSAIEVAVPYSPGSPAIFVSAEIRHVHELGNNLFRYGVAYTRL